MTDEQIIRIGKSEEQINKLEITIERYKTLATVFIVLGFVSIFVFYGLLLNDDDAQNQLIDKLGAIS